MTVRFLAAISDGLLESLSNPVRDEKLGIFGPAIEFLCQFDFVFPEWLAMGSTQILFVRGTIADVGIDDDQGWAVFCIQEVVVRLRELIEIVGIAYVCYVPPVGFKASAHIFTEGPVRGSIKSYVIVVVNPAEIWEAKVPGQRGRFTPDALHHVAVTTDCVD